MNKDSNANAQVMDKQPKLRQLGISFKSPSIVRLLNRDKDRKRRLVPKNNKLENMNIQWYEFLTQEVSGYGTVAIYLGGFVFSGVCGIIVYQLLSIVAPIRPKHPEAANFSAEFLQTMNEDIKELRNKQEEHDELVRRLSRATQNPTASIRQRCEKASNVSKESPELLAFRGLNVECVDEVKTLTNVKSSETEVLCAIESVLQTFLKCEEDGVRSLNKSSELCNSLLRHDGLEALQRHSESENPTIKRVSLNLLHRVVPTIWQ